MVHVPNYNKLFFNFFIELLVKSYYSFLRISILSILFSQTLSPINNYQLRTQFHKRNCKLLNHIRYNKKLNYLLVNTKPQSTCARIYGRG